MTTQSLTIGKAAKVTGLTPKLIRYYESVGLIPAARRRDSGPFSQGYRLFTLEDTGRLELVAKARALGFPLKKIGELLQCTGDGCCPTTVPKLQQLLAQRLQELDEKQAALQALGAELKRLALLVEERVNKPLEPCPPGTSPCACAFGAPVELVLNLQRRVF